MTTYLKTAIDAALNAGKAIMDIYASDDFGIEKKSDDSPLTRADKAAHDIIHEKLKIFNIPVLSEEGKHISFEERKNWNKLWIVDPIDGTKEFIKKNGEFTVNIALVDNQRPVLGVIYVPAKEELYFAESKQAFKLTGVNAGNFEELNAEKMDLPLKTHLEKNKTMKSAIVVASKSHLTQETQDFIDDLKKKYDQVNTLSKGSSLKLCMVAEGAADYYPRFAPTMEWDTAAGQAICTASGCHVIDQKTQRSILYNRENLLNNWFLVKR